MKKLIVLVALVAAGWFWMKKTMDMEDASPSEVVEALKERMTEPLDEAEQNAAEFQKSQEERVRRAAEQ